jgi:DNA-binding response OmpR family regulator
MAKEKTRILVIEDNPADSNFVTQLIEDFDQGSFSVECAELLSTGLNRLSAGDMDAVLLDLGLPDSQGLATLAEVYWQIPETPVIVLTGHDDEETAVKAVKLGAQDYLVKGEVDSKLLVRSIRYAIERNILKRELDSLRQSFTSIVDNSPDGLLVVNRRTGEVLYANPRAALMLGKSQEDLIGPEIEMDLEVDTSTKVEIQLPDGNLLDVEVRISDTEWKEIPAYLVIMRAN